MIDVIALDADDTLWHNEILHLETEERLQSLLSPYGLDGQVTEALYETEVQNLPYFGYGTKSFGLSMIETAIQLTRGQISAGEIQEILDLVKGMLQAPVRLLDDVPEVVASLAETHPLLLVTKGDLVDQERKVAQSGLGSYFTAVEIVSAKSPEVYRALLDKHGVAPERFLMVGNSLRSDVLPVVALGAQAVHIPYDVTWAHEVVPVTQDAATGYVELERIGQLPAYVERLNRRSGVGVV